MTEGVCERCGRTVEEWPCNEDGSDWVDPSGRTFPELREDGRLMTGYAGSAVHSAVGADPDPND